MISRARIATYLTAFSVLLPLVLLFAYGQGAREKGLFVYHACLLTGIAAMYWFHGFMYFIKRQRAEPAVTFQACLHDLFFPLTLLVMVSVLFTGFFTIADEIHKVRSMSIGADKSFPYAARFAVAVIEVFPETRFPLGVAVYAFWGAFVLNNFNFIHRIVNDDFPPRVPILATLRVVAAIFASILVYFAFFSDTFDFGLLPYTGKVAIFRDHGPAIPGNLIVLSFFAGLFPLVSLRMVYRWVGDRFSQMTGLGKYTYTPLTVIDGVTLQVEERLLESGIDSIQALATANLKDLKDPGGKGLPYPEDMLTEWIDQAKLAVYFYDERHFAVIRSLGIRTYSAMQQYQAQMKRSPEILDKIDPQPIPKDSFRHLVLYGQFP